MARRGDAEDRSMKMKPRLKPSRCAPSWPWPFVAETTSTVPVLAAPVIGRNDLAVIDPAKLATLANRDVIAVGQNQLGASGRWVPSLGVSR